jgi:adenosylhomocysteine nucleosidase
VIVLVTEDDRNKRDTIVNYLLDCGVERSQIRTAANMVEFSSEFSPEVSVCVIDLCLPAFDGGEIQKNGIGILQVIERSKAADLKLIAISSYPEEFENVRPQFESRGCIIADFHKTEVWQSALKNLLVQAASRESFDFIVFTALTSERQPYTSLESLNGKAVSKGNLTRYDITIEGKRGTVIELPRMGIVDAAVTASVCIERFTPKVVCMSGICAGFPKHAALGQLLVAELAYEYQSGKWTDDGFSQEPYQVPVSENLRTLLRGLTAEDELLTNLELGWKQVRPAEMRTPHLAAFTSGSAVIADSRYLAQVGSHHRRVAGLDMETYAIFRAAHLARSKPEIICAKVVVDLADTEKDDRLHPYGCTISARFVVHALKEFFASKTAQ